MRAIYLPTARHGGIELRDVNGLPDIQRAVRGLFENVGLDFPKMNMLVNEDGMSLQLPINYRATAILWVHSARHAFETYIRGNVLLVGGTDADGEYMDVPEFMTELIMTSSRYNIERQVIDGEHPHRVLSGLDDLWDAYAAAIKLMERHGFLYQVKAA